MKPPPGIRAKRQVNVRTIAADLSSDAAVRKVAAEAGDLDILVNNAGAIPPGDVLSIDDAKWRTAWDLKVFGYISFCRVVYGQMKARQGRRHHQRDRRGGGEFPDQLHRGCRWEWVVDDVYRALGKGAPADGLRVGAINPGPVETDRLVMLRRAEAQQKFGDPERWRELTAGMPFGRAASPAEIGNAVAFLASPVSGYTTGTVLTINGGG